MITKSILYRRKGACVGLKLLSVYKICMEGYIKVDPTGRFHFWGNFGWDQTLVWWECCVLRFFM